MKIDLNTYKAPFCTIGPYSWSFANETYDVDVDSLDKKLKQQLLYNIQRGTLQTEEDISVLREEATIVNLVPPESKPIVQQDISLSIESVHAQREQQLKKILNGTIPSVKKESRDMRLGSLRRLKELEIEGKNRKKLLEFFDEILATHQQEVKIAKGSEDLVAEEQDTPNMLSTQLTDIVESEEEQLVIPQEVLNKL